MLKYSNAKHCITCERKCTTFRCLSEDELDLMNGHRFQVKFKAGEMIFKQGTGSSHIVSFNSGLAKLYTESPQNKNIIFNIIKPTVLLGCPGAFTDYRHHFSLSAITDSEVCLLETDIFKKILKSNENFHDNFIRNFSEKMIDFFQRFGGIIHKQMPGRIADSLLYLSEEVFQSPSFNMLISRTELAEMSGMTKESACRVLKSFKNEGIIETNKNHIQILKPAVLKKISETG